MKSIVAAAVVVAAAIAAGTPARAAVDQPACPENLGGTTMMVSGKVVEVGDDKFSQYMVVVDDATTCRVVIFVDDGVMPCAYGDIASIALKVRKAEEAEVNYFDGGGEEPYFCSKPE